MKDKDVSMDSQTPTPTPSPTPPTMPTKPPAASSSRPIIVVIAAAVVVLAALGIYFFTRSEPAVTPAPEAPATETPAPETTPPPATTAPEATPPAATTPPAVTETPPPPQMETNDLMQAGPLGEKWLGREDAPVTVIEYASMTCSHCAHFHEATYPAFKSKYIDTGKVRFIFREFPLDSLAAGAIMLARCAPNDGYFPIVDLLFDRQNEWAFVEKPLDALLGLVRQAGFTQESFRACLSNQQVLDGVSWVRDRAAEKFGVDSTPTFFINGKKYPGALEIDQLEKILDPLLKQ